MKRPVSWVHWLLAVCACLAAAEYAALAWVVPRYVRYGIQDATSGAFSVGEAKLVFPAAISLHALRSMLNTSDAAVTVQRVVARPLWLSARDRTVWLDAVHIEQPMVRVTRTASGVVRPDAPLPLGKPGTAGESHSVASAPSPWRMYIKSLSVTDGIVEFIDASAPQTFHGVLHHLSIVAGPVELPAGRSQITFAVRGELVGHGGHAAPIYCSGWVDLAAKDLQASCRLEPLALAAFEPYYSEGRVRIRAYDTTIQSASQWVAQANALEGHVQLELGNLREGDVSVRGTTVVDVKQLAGGDDVRLTGELTITGPLDDASQWRSELAPGDANVQQIFEPLLARGIDILKIPFGRRKIDVSLVATDAGTTTRIEEISKHVEHELEILAVPAPPTSEEPVAPAEVPAVSAEAGVATSPAAPAAPAEVTPPSLKPASPPSVPSEAPEPQQAEQTSPTVVPVVPANRQAP